MFDLVIYFLFLHDINQFALWLHNTEKRKQLQVSNSSNLFSIGANFLIRKTLPPTSPEFVANALFRLPAGNGSHKSKREMSELMNALFHGSFKGLIQNPTKI